MTSCSHRQKGNEFFQQGKESRSLDNKRKLFWTAIDWYTKADKFAAAMSTDKASAQKNLAAAHHELAKVEWEGCPARAWDHFSKSLEAGRTAAFAFCARNGDNDWLSALADKTIAKALKSLLDLTSSMPTSKNLLNKLHKISETVSLLDLDSQAFLEIAVNFYLDIANRYLHQAVLETKHGEFSNAYAHAMDMNFPLEEAKRFSSRNDEILLLLDDEIKVLSEDQNIQTTLFRAKLELETGKGLLKNLQFDGNEWIAEGLVALDHLKIGYLLVTERGLDFRIEAELSTYLGVAYFKILGMKERGGRFLSRAIEMVLCFEKVGMQGCRSSSWYQLAEKTSREIQKLIAAEEEGTLKSARDKLRDSGVIKTLETEMNKRNPNGFVNFIYKNYPIRKDCKVPDESLEVKKRLQKAMVHFHPDKFSNPKSDEEKYNRVLAEEISKRLSNFYEVQKGAD